MTAPTGSDPGAPPDGASESTAPLERPAGLPTWTLFLLGLVAAPLLLTGLARLVGSLLPFAFIGVGVFAVGLWPRSRWRPLWVGLSVGSVAHFVFLAWLFTQWGGLGD